MSNLTVSLVGVDPPRLLDDWHWLVPARMSVHSVTLLGDMFLSDPAGLVHWLDVAGGTLSLAAESESAFQQAILDPARQQEWFMSEVVTELAAAGSKLRVGQCYGYKLPPCLGGSFAASNFEPTDLLVHFSILGQIHAQTKGLPEGTPVSKFVTK